MGKLKSIFELAENLSLVLTKLDTELGLAQPQLVFTNILSTSTFIAILDCYSMVTWIRHGYYWNQLVEHIFKSCSTSTVG